ncbi:uncharacterized protein A4U43_C07F22390 [Asparagus officinalis]|uniref:Uncharacterized protein n=1 Tax=Asparagus officinalis TaxID=4686 RepID=A0A5P1EJ81_ASPOF|nr:uncharacterized protein A4U43_C07F22390 [Asparagus officinalis]
MALKDSVIEEVRKSRPSSITLSTEADTGHMMASSTHTNASQASASSIPLASVFTVVDDLEMSRRDEASLMRFLSFFFIDRATDVSFTDSSLRIDISASAMRSFIVATSDLRMSYASANRRKSSRILSVHSDPDPRRRESWFCGRLRRCGCSSDMDITSVVPNVADETSRADSAKAAPDIEMIVDETSGANFDAHA